jgi:superfamily II DNA or RNA helicase
LQAIADAGVSALIVTPTIDLRNQWHATLTNAFGDQLSGPIGVLGGAPSRRIISPVTSSRVHMFSLLPGRVMASPASGIVFSREMG